MERTRPVPRAKRLVRLADGICTEGSPFLISEIEVFLAWSGAESGDESDHARAFELLRGKDAAPLKGGIVWKATAGGGGVIDVWRTRRSVDPPEIVLLHSSERELPKRSALVNGDDVREDGIGTLQLHEGALVVVNTDVRAAELLHDDQADVAACLRAAASLRPPIRLHSGAFLGVGTFVPTPTGPYRVTVGRSPSQDESRWCRFLRQSD